ncbi:MAG: hypothetical protein JNK21_09920 [Rhodospirillaceae bacterium]|nr:hypothetical protein [Rhodospirillaceae bacterium]
MFIVLTRRLVPALTVSLMFGLCFVLPAKSQDNATPGTLSGTVAATSDYVFRGYSQTQNDPALQAGVTWSLPSGIYAGVWGSNVEFTAGDKADLEVDLTAGYAGKADALSYDLGVIYYAYPDARSGSNYGYWEGALKLAYDFGPAVWSGGFYYTPDNFGGTKDGAYLTTGIRVPFAEKWAVDANLGRAEVNPAYGADYFDWNVGLSYAFPWFDASLRYTDTDNDANCARLCDARGVFTISKSF